MRRRVERLNSLLKEVLCEVIRHDIKHAKNFDFSTVSRVSFSADLKHAQVFVSIIGSQGQKQELLATLRSITKYIAVLASKKMTIRFFPILTFQLDDTVDKVHRIETLLDKVLPQESSS